LILPSPGLTVPISPANLAAVSGDGQVSLSWTGISPVSAYNIYRGSASGGEALLVSNYIGSNYTDTVANGSTYYYTVTGVNSAGESGASNEAHATATKPVSVATPIFTPAGGTYTSAQSVTISDSTSGSTVYYTTNGATPTTSSPKYSTAIPVSATQTIKAIAVASGYNNSALASAAYIISPPTATTTSISATRNPSSFGDPVKFTATIKPAVPNGETVTFYDRSTSIGAGITQGGTASLTTNSLAAGPHSIIAAYAGDHNNLSSSSSALAETITGKLLSFTLTPATVVGGTAATGGVAIAISVSGTAASVSFPSKVIVAGGHTSATFVIQTHTNNATSSVTLIAGLGTVAIPASLTVTFVAGGTQAAGLQFFSEPWSYNDLLPNIFEDDTVSGQIASWNAENFTYAYQGGGISSPTAVAITPGIAYWTVFPAQGECLLYLGAPASPTSPIVLNLSPGYNGIGDPYTAPLTISSLTLGVGNIPFAQASGQLGVISSTLYYYSQGIDANSGSYVPAHVSDSLVPGKGYWIYAYKPTTITFPVPSSSATLSKDAASVIAEHLAL
jgi:hypothetical protein